ncbi:MAG: S9 family peptidase [bacterium]|nr:S9 family peptidase [bacterium]
MNRISIIIVLIIAILSIGTVTNLEAGTPKEEKNAFVPVPATIINKNVPPIPIEIKEKSKQYSKIKPSYCAAVDPRGRGLIITTRLTDTDNTAQLYMQEKPLGKLTKLTHFKEPVTRATFSPDCSKNYFLFRKDSGGAENTQIFKYDPDTGKSTLLTDGKSLHRQFKFNHKGDTIAYPGNSRDGRSFDIYIMNPEKPGAAQLVFKARTTAFYTVLFWLHDDRHIVVGEKISAAKYNSLLVDTVTGKVKDLTPKSEAPLFFKLYASSKDGKYFYGSSDMNSQFQHFIRMERATSKIDVLTGDLPWDIDKIAVDRQCTRVLFSTNENGFNRLYKMDPDTLKYKAITTVPEGIIRLRGFDGEGKNIFMTLSNSRMSSEAFQLEIKTGKVTRWTKGDTGGLDFSGFVLPKLIHYPTFDKVDGKTRQIPAFYYRPVKKTGKPYPVILKVHGGPESQYRPYFQGQNNYLINELGIAIIAPNVRGSLGYGKTYTKLDNWEKREDSVRDIGALLDWIATRPELDKNRVAIMGGSYGGYMVLASMIHYNDRLTCGVDIVGISNFVTFLKNTSDYRRDFRRREYGDERKIGAFLQKISPTTNAHKIKKPLFVIQGKNDPRVPLSEAAQIVDTLKGNKIPVWYQVGTNEGHGFRKKDNRDFMKVSIVRFLQEYLLK